MKKILFILLTLMITLPALIHAQTCGTTNIALSKPVTVSGQQEYHPGSDAVDGNGSTGWYINTDTSYIYVDLIQSYNICKIRINWTSNGRGKDYKAQISTDAINWTDMFTRTNNTANSDSFTVSGSGRYVRIYTTARVNVWSSLEMLELRIFNSLAGNSTPFVSLTAPTNNATFNAGDNITVSATASDPDGSIAKVEFYNDQGKIGEDVTAPYSITWSNVQIGNYTLRARAIDNNFTDSLSLPVNISVNASGGWSLVGNQGTSSSIHFLGTTDDQPLKIRTNNTEKMAILANGFVGIGTDSMPDTDAKLGVNGAIYTTKLKVTQTGWADYVFAKGYDLLPIRDLENYVKTHQHLPGVPAAKEVIGKPVDVAHMQELLLKKIEELTLYIIEQQKQIDDLKKKVEEKEK